MRPRPDDPAALTLALVIAAGVIAIIFVLATGGDDKGRSGTTQTTTQQTTTTERTVPERDRPGGIRIPKIPPIDVTPGDGDNTTTGDGDGGTTAPSGGR